MTFCFLQNKRFSSCPPVFSRISLPFVSIIKLGQRFGGTVMFYDKDDEDSPRMMDVRSLVTFSSFGEERFDLQPMDGEIAGQHYYAAAADVGKTARDFEQFNVRKVRVSRLLM